MTDDLIELARRAVACDGWRWMAGMRLTCGDRLAQRGDRWWHAFAVNGSWVRHRIKLMEDESRGPLPDLTDPATLGCLLALVREAWGDDEAYARTIRIGGRDLWATHAEQTVGLRTERGPVMSEDGRMVMGPTEAAALVAALEAAPR